MGASWGFSNVAYSGFRGLLVSFDLYAILSYCFSANFSEYLSFCFSICFSTNFSTYISTCFSLYFSACFRGILSIDFSPYLCKYLSTNFSCYLGTYFSPYACFWLCVPYSLSSYISLSRWTWMTWLICYSMSSCGLLFLLDGFTLLVLLCIGTYFAAYFFGISFFSSNGSVYLRITLIGVKIGLFLGRGFGSSISDLRRIRV
jgi:hypothetical protein